LQPGHRGHPVLMFLSLMKIRSNLFDKSAHRAT
jgi:hypothetical protein